MLVTPAGVAKLMNVGIVKNLDDPSAVLVRAAGWRIEPPVLVPLAGGASRAASAAALPPPEPPGCGPGPRLGVVPYEEISVEEFVEVGLARITIPVSSNPPRDRPMGRQVAPMRSWRGCGAACG